MVRGIRRYPLDTLRVVGIAEIGARYHAERLSVHFFARGVSLVSAKSSRRHAVLPGRHRVHGIVVVQKLRVGAARGERHRDVVRGIGRVVAMMVVSRQNFRVFERLHLLGIIGIELRLDRVRRRNMVASGAGAVARVAAGGWAHHVLHRNVDGGSRRRGGGAGLHGTRRQCRYLSAVAHQRNNAITHLSCLVFLYDAYITTAFTKELSFFSSDLGTKVTV